MPFGPYYNALPVGGNGKRYVDQASWNAIVDNFVNWKDNVNAGGYNLSNVGQLNFAPGGGLEFTDLTIPGTLTITRTPGNTMTSRWRVDSDTASDRAGLFFVRRSLSGAATPANARLGVIAFIGWDGAQEPALSMIDSFNVGTPAMPAGDVRFSTRGADGSWGERVRIAHNGNVGIGNADPQSRLDLGGAPGGSDVIRIGTYGSEVYGIGVNAGSVDYFMPNVSGRAIRFGKGTASSFTELARLTDSGYVGIGTPAPVRHLEVSSGSYTELVLSSTMASNDNGRCWGFAMDPTTRHLTIRAANANLTTTIVAITMLPNGNVGIGGYSANAPASRLSLGNHSDHTGILQRIAVYEADGGQYFRGIGFCRLGGGNGFGLGLWGRAVATLPTDTNADMIINDAGYIGINKVTPLARRVNIVGDIGISQGSDYHYVLAPESSNAFFSLFYAATSDYPKLRYHFSGRLHIPVSSTAPSDADIGNSEATIWYDQSNNRLAFRCKTSAGVLKTGYVNVA